MKRKGTKALKRKGTKKDLKTRARQATSVKGGAVYNALPGSGVVAVKDNLQLDTCWIEGPARQR